jgi:hypothetical protein
MLLVALEPDGSPLREPAVNFHRRLRNIAMNMDFLFAAATPENGRTPGVKCRGDENERE